MAALLAVGIASGPLGARSETFFVDTTLDLADDTPGNGLCQTLIVVGIDPPLLAPRCSLRAAIEEANALLGADTILLPPGHYFLGRDGSGEDAGAAGDLDVWDDLEISGGWPCSGPNPCGILGGDAPPGPTDTVVGWANSFPEAERDRVLDTHASAGVDLFNLTIRGGRAAIGAGIRAGLGDLQLLRCIVRENVADDPGGAATTIAGAGIALEGGTLEILLSEINDNEARDPLGPAGTSEAGGIRNRGGVV